MAGKYTFPLTLVCCQCDQEFVLQERNTKTGPMSPYCSDECRRVSRNHRWQKNYWARTYGLTAEAFEKMLATQGNRCACCGEPFHRKPTNGRRSAHIDHCHETGRVRGLLCSGCNVAAGKFEKRGEWVAAYLARTSLDLRDWCVS